jgi:hypothetical protein
VHDNNSKNVKLIIMVLQIINQNYLFSFHETNIRPVALI